MKYRQPDMTLAIEGELQAFKALPRPVFGHASTLPNRPISKSHSHVWGQLSYAIEGVIEVSAPDAHYVAPPAFAVWIPAGTLHGVRCSGNTTLRSLYVDPVALPLPPSDCRVLEVTPLLRELISEFSKAPVEYDENGPTGRLVKVLLDQLVCAPNVALMLPWPEDQRLRAICEEMQANLESRLNLTECAQLLGLSERTISRLFLQQTGLTFRLWRQRLRLLGALPLLEQGDRVTDVAIACGYDSMSSFIAAFRNQMGVTPGEYLSRRQA
ncbi:helix-turn-helix transcriptional regulator [Noviherbaspirillum sp.]|uniref:helix-turn-helix transcriptional regulator n=1 Tax=Noviherbaspirillum sp. TaxID=1926288 RepID=UPI002B460C92|nr:helix-turn-helix transcriptional regulator [Noviherbaspirillum sp.]HJV83746.1 helix-turn-helix transcriptional regulator [Noviherbaspirillum sp.]